MRTGSGWRWTRPWRTRGASALWWPTEMRLSAVLLACSLAGVIGGAALIGLWAVGAAVIFDSLAVGVFALQRDDGTGRDAPSVHEVPTLARVLERARRSG